MPKIPLAMQMYTLRDLAAADFPGTLKSVAEIGYAGVELIGRGSLSVRELKSLLDELHLSVAGSHVPLEDFEADLPKVIDEALAIGSRFVTIPYLAEERRKDADGYKAAAETLNGFGDTVRGAGLTLCYHNHAFEFEPLPDGSRGMDILLENTDPMLVKAEIDTYWVLLAGADPAEYVRRHPGRVPLMHLKDRDLADGSPAEIGTGDLPLDAVVSAADAVGTQWLIVEQDTCKRPPLESIALSYSNLKAKGYA